VENGLYINWKRHDDGDNFMKQKIVAFVQARMSSSRLPGKVLKDITGEPMLVHVVERAKKAKLINQVVVATTDDPSDDAIEALCKKYGYAVYHGNLHDVLDRFYQAAKQYQADVVVRFTADCPLLDPLLIDETIQAFLDNQVDFAANRLPPPFTRTYPIGLDTEVCSFVALERAWHEAKEKYEREHVLPYLYQVEGRFKVCRVEYEKDYGSWRITVDTQADLDMVRKIFEHFGKQEFNWLDVIHYLEAHPEIAKINANVAHKTVFDVDHRS
jgi:spore coat polysaccharide biosynthesis protein SpsF